MSNKHLIQLFIFMFSSKSASVFLQSHPKDFLRTSFQTKWKIQTFQFKFVQKMNSGLEFQRANIRMRISILNIQVSNLRKLIIEIRINVFEILCVYVRVCHFSGKTNSFDFFSPNLNKNGFRVSNSESYCRNKNQHPRYTMCANFQSK